MVYIQQQIEIVLSGCTLSVQLQLHSGQHPTTKSRHLLQPGLAKKAASNGFSRACARERSGWLPFAVRMPRRVFKDTHLSGDGVRPCGSICYTRSCADVPSSWCVTVTSRPLHQTPGKAHAALTSSTTISLPFSYCWLVPGD